MEGELVHLFQASATDAIGFSTSLWRDESRIDIRKYVRTIDDDNLIPTKKGISLPAGLFSELLGGIKALSSVMASEKVVAKISKTEGEQVWIGTNKFEGHQLVFIRTYLFNKDKGEWFPTQKGVSVRSHLLPELEQGIEILRKKLAGEV